jgi:peptide alpha-N-acetyltransferase
MKSNTKGNWLSYAVAKHLNGEPREALQVLDAYQGTLSSANASERERGFESSELAMYANSIMGSLSPSEALQHLHQVEAVVVDRGAWLQHKAHYELQLGRFDDARNSYLAMFDRGVSDDYRIHSGYMCAVLHMDPPTCQMALNVRGMDTLATIRTLRSDQKKILLDSYQNELTSRVVPYSPAMVRIALTLLEGDALKTALDVYCRKNLAKGVPSLGRDLSSLLLLEKDGTLFRATDGVDIRSHPTFHTLVELADSYIATTTPINDNNDDESSPSTILWAWYLRAGLHELAQEYSQGIALLDLCLEHTPTAVDVYELKASLLKAGGDIQAAVECLDHGRELDQQDRYINNQTTKYMLQAGMEETALERISMFTKHEGNPEHNLFLMQCSWYELELAACLARKGKWGLSLKKYREYEYETMMR